ITREKIAEYTGDLRARHSHFSRASSCERHRCSSKQVRWRSSASTLANVSTASAFVSGELPLPPASPQGEKTTASQHQPRQARSDDRAGHADIHRPGIASLATEYVGNEDVQIGVRGSHVSNR